MPNPILGYWYRLYNNQTRQEQAVEKVIAPLGFRYRCQHLFRCGSKTYFADFWLPDLNLVVEIDDPSHNAPDKRKKDLQRTKALQALGLTVIRFTNQEVDTKLDYVTEKLRSTSRAQTEEHHQSHQQEDSSPQAQTPETATPPHSDQYESKPKRSTRRR